MIHLKSATIFELGFPVRLGGKSAEIPYQYAETPEQKHRTYRAWVDDVWLMPYKLLEMVLQEHRSNFSTMKINSPFRSLVCFLSVLTFSTPFVTVAQQNSVMFETGSNTAQNANTVAIAAKVAAEQDAGSDTNGIFWFGAGFVTFAIGCPIGGCVGCGVGSIVDPSHFFDSTGQGIGCMVGQAVGVLIPIVRIYNRLPHPPPERLIGKSPEYVEFYTDTYKAKTRSLRTKLAAAGASTGCGLAILGCLVSEW